MSFSLRSFAAGLVLVTASLLSGCGGGSGKPAPGMGCALNSDCATGLICTFGLCHGACVPNAANGDCPAPQLCVKSSGTVDGGGSLNVCQLPMELKCVYNSDCMSPLICARDEQCRNQCQTNVDCVMGQVCTDSKVCALTSQLVQGTNDVQVVTAGLDGGAGAPGTGGSVGTGGAGATGTGGAAGSAGATGLAGSTGKGGAGGATGVGGASGTCSPACAVGKQCVAGTCQSCGVAGATCCGSGTSATCNSNLSCVSGTCTCGDSAQACCEGTTCNTGFQCVSGTCTCGGSAQYCCAGATKCTGSLICGGRRCGCAKACDESAVLKNDGSIFVSGTPVTNTNGTLFLANSVSDNGSFACAVKADGTVWCWGSNSYGMLGIGDTTITSSKVPLQVSTAMASGSPLTGITAVSVADVGYNACALGTNGTVWCWGYGAYGQLGIGDESNSSFAVPVVADAGAVPVTGFKSISTSYYNTCGIKTDNSVWCWGDNYYGEIGNGTDGQTTPAKRYVPYPAQVTNLATSGTSVIASYYYYTVCASTADGSAYCWGYNSYGDLANGLATGYSNVPSQVMTAAGVPLSGVVSVLNWSGKPCAFKTDGSIWCWPDSSSNYYAVQLKDSQSNRVTGLSVVGRDCYLDTDDQAWLNGSTSTSYQVTCP